MMTYDFMRERILNNNSLLSFYDQNSAFSPMDPDHFYKERSLYVESKIADYKVSSPKILRDLVNYLNVTDSELFCQEVIG